MRALFSILVVACISCSDGRSEVEEKPTQTAALAQAAVMPTFIPHSIQIDALGSPGDANLLAADDPNSASVDMPLGGPASFIDWSDLAVVSDLSNHRLLDLNGAGGKDPSSFPGSNECVGTSNVLAKMNLTYAAAASNSRFAYFAVQRAKNDGDAAYYWILTQKEPHLVAGGAPCKGSQSRLTYDISPGDVLLAGHFNPSAGPTLLLFKANAFVDNVPAPQIASEAHPVWESDSSTVIAAVNTTSTPAGALGAAGVVSVAGDMLDPGIFAEAAVDMMAIVGSSSCGAQFYTSVITRPSSSQTSDLKDLIGPVLFDFGSLTATATLTPMCDGTVVFNAAATGPNGLSVTPACSWTFSDGTTAVGCNGAVTVSAGGAVSGTVDVAIPGCAQTVTTDPVTLLEPLSVSISPAGSGGDCTNGPFGFTAVPSGGNGSYTYTWSVASCGNAPTCDVSLESMSLCGSIPVQVSVSDSSGLCPAATSETETLSKQTSVTITDN